ncbi:hypothetical protein AB205_0177100, partial [Aquarana catesbeiana]
MPASATEECPPVPPISAQCHLSAVPGAHGEKVTIIPQQLAGVDDVESPAEVLATEQSAANLCPAPATTTEFQGDGTVGPSPQQQVDVVKLLLPAKSRATGATHLPIVDGTSVSTCLPQGCCAVGPDPQQHDGVSLVTLTSLQRLKGLQGEGPVHASPQRLACSLREAEIGWVSNA